MTTIGTSTSGINYLIKVLKQSSTSETRTTLWRIPHHDSEIKDICLKIGRYNKNDKSKFKIATLETETPKSELTLNNEEFESLINFLIENYEPFKEGIKKYIAIEVDEKLNENDLKKVFANNNKKEILSFITNNNVLSQDLVSALSLNIKKNYLNDFKNMLLDETTPEKDWQKWFEINNWIFGSDFIKLVNEREIDTNHITDFLMQAYDGYLDIIEIKKPSLSPFWSPNLDHNNYIPSQELIKAVTQSLSYVFEVEREANSLKFNERVGLKVVKPRCVLVYGRSNEWNEKQNEAYRILNSSYYNLTILTYDQVLIRANKMFEENDIKSE